MKRSLPDNLHPMAAFRALSLGGRHKRRIVIISPHPDDEILGAGRLILEAVWRGANIAFIVLTDGDASHPQSRKWPRARLGRLRRGELRRALGRLGLPNSQIRFMGWRDGRLAKNARPLALRAMLHDLRAETVLVTSPADHHPDHKAAYRLVRLAVDCRRMTLWTYAVWSRLSTNARPAAGTHRWQQAWGVKAHRSQTTRFIDDDPEGFSFPPETLARLLSTAEQYGR
ncbi:MAG: PIG-L deacetylase family protein [Sphingorhabdus sp.]